MKIYTQLEEIDIIELYSSLDYDRKIKQYIGKEKEAYTKNGESEKSKLCQIEIDTLNFITRDDTISYTLAGTDNEGNPFEYPNIKSFTKDDFEYLKNRLKNTTNLYLKARYAHLLWHSPKKHIDYAKIAASSYFEAAKLLYQRIGTSDNSSLRINTTNTLKNAILLSLKLKDKSIFEEIKIYFLEVVKDFSRADELFLNTSFLKFMLDNKKVFKRENFEGLEQKIYDVAQGKEDFNKIEILKLGQKIDVKLGNKKLHWDKEIAECYESLSYKRKDDSNMIATHFAQDAVKHFKLAKEVSKIKELTDRYQYLKENMRLGKFSTEIDLTKIMNFVENFSEKVSDFKTEGILLTLMYDKNILPSNAELENQAKEQKKNHPLQFFCTTTIIDNNGHVSEYFSTEEESMHNAVLQNFNMSIKLCRGYLLRAIFNKGVTKGNITTLNFTNFMRNETWLGQDITRTYTQGEPEVYNWLNLIMPAINDYLTQLYFYFTNQNNHVNLVLCIDSLAIKIEGILRDMMNMKGSTTFFFTKDKSGRSVAREKDINALLHDDDIIDFLSEDDLLFFRYLLVEKAGLNLRNKVSHSLLRHPQNYSIEYMNLLIVAILRLAKNEYCPFPKGETDNINESVQAKSES